MSYRQPSLRLEHIVCASNEQIVREGYSKCEYPAVYALQERGWYKPLNLCHHHIYFSLDRELVKIELLYPGDGCSLARLNEMIYRRWGVVDSNVIDSLIEHDGFVYNDKYLHMLDDCVAYTAKECTFSFEPW